MVRSSISLSTYRRRSFICDSGMGDGYGPTRFALTKRILKKSPPKSSSCARYMRKRRRPFIWLGEEENASFLARDFFGHVGVTMRHWDEEYEEYPKQSAVLSQIQRLGFDKKRSAPTWRALSHFFLRPYFQRSWVRQEAAVSKELVPMLGFCGIPWEWLDITITVLIEINMFTVPLSLKKQRTVDPSAIF